MTSDLLAFDQAHIWHPYTSATAPLPTQLVTSAEGVRLKLADGRELIDGMASWWCAIHGYNHPDINAALHTQLSAMSHVMFGGITHEPAITLCKTLIDITPEALQHVFLADSGSISVEVAIKMALQYWQATGQTKKRKLLSLRGGYHGDTFAAMSVCDPDTGMHHLFNQAVTPQFFTERPSSRFETPFSAASLADLEAVFAQHHADIAAIILEPIVQGAGGMWLYHPDYLKRVRQLCDHYHVLLIADEIATGFGRTGKLFACEWAEITPDILCVGKALTGGYMTLAATLTSSKIAQGISQNGGVFMHGPTFMGNPLACAAANASLKLLLNQDWAAQVKRLERTLKDQLMPAQQLSTVADVRVLGGIGIIEMVEPIDPVTAQAFFVARGVWVRPFGKLLYVMPPFIMSDADLTTVCQAMLDFAQHGAA
ncbi:adenosylmethionine--8-amino-7-oxononanoate transaminase [Arenicella xantha]|uniref:Adenosylmethionine-8-amino-7-oxononanoate aminotransferase n=1 Tax=Arenicella xantha TaxID=644221 RepID=A0A395JHR1_9GAMM|nr:adenosylmethionine--8-amino-7-oxononanoate transaminase [Arenicella xantha]RBP49213.1 adenosylmethionine-8-amino-7-oxononanoate aminotransferase [Arenicella xantha]